MTLHIIILNLGLYLVYFRTPLQTAIIADPLRQHKNYIIRTQLINIKVLNKYTKHNIFNLTI